MTPIPDSLRPLLERVAKPVETQYDRDQRWTALEELRALLAQPQPSAAQSAPAGVVECSCNGQQRLIGGGCAVCNLHDDIHQLAFETGEPDENASGYWFELEQFDEFITKLRPMLAAPAHPAPRNEKAGEWIACSERLPESERTVLAFYLNSHGKGRRVRAEYIAAKTKSADDGWDSDEPADYDEQADEYFWPAGWYEVMDNWDDLTHMVIHEGGVTHWMPLPAPPALSQQADGGVKS